MKKAVIIGGGLSGLTVAVKLADRRFDVLVLEKNAYLGGRASNVIDEKTGNPIPIGPHIILGNYNHFFKFLEKIGSKEAIVWADFLIEIIYKGYALQAWSRKQKSPGMAICFY